MVRIIRKIEVVITLTTKTILIIAVKAKVNHTHTKESTMDKKQKQRNEEKANEQIDLQHNARDCETSKSFGKGVSRADALRVPGF